MQSKEKKLSKLREQLNQITCKTLNLSFPNTGLVRVRLVKHALKRPIHIQAYKGPNGYLFDKKISWSVLRTEHYDALLTEFQEWTSIAKACYGLGELSMQFGTWKFGKVDNIVSDISMGTSVGSESTGVWITRQEHVDKTVKSTMLFPDRFTQVPPRACP